MDDLLASAQRMQEQLLAAKAEAEATVVEGQAGGGAVKVTVTGGLEFRSVSIDPSAVDPHDVSMLEDLVLAALHDAVAKAQEAQAGAMGGLDMGGLGGILGP
jgi:DNA-binding YbaB/EbfC family protein